MLNITEGPFRAEESGVYALPHVVRPRAIGTTLCAALVIGFPSATTIGGSLIGGSRMTPKQNPVFLARADRQTCLNVRNWHIPPALDPKSLQTSCDLLWQVRAALPLLRESDPTGSVLDASVSERFCPISTPDDSGGGRYSWYPVELGFGLSRQLRQFIGGTAQCEVTLVSSNGALVGWSATCRLDAASQELDAASQEIVEGALGGDANFTIVHEFPRALKRSRQALDRKLGRLTEVHERSTATSAYAVLMSPFEALVVGSG
jgi:hypothetical protein